jgi:hypothetical protein
LLGDNALEEAHGNIGANVAAGDGNLQANVAAITGVNDSSAREGERESSGSGDSGASLGMARVAVDQQLQDNDRFETESSTYDRTTIGDDALKGAAGNIGVNAAAGDTNAQANAAAIASADSAFVFAHGNAEVAVDQQATGNSTGSRSSRTEANIDGDALRGAKGNIGANAVAGTSNAQHNGVALASGSDSMADASVSVRQDSQDDVFWGFNYGGAGSRMKNAALDGDALRDARGNIGANVAAGHNNLQANSLGLTKVGK